MFQTKPRFLEKNQHNQQYVIIEAGNVSLDMQFTNFYSLQEKHYVILQTWFAYIEEILIFFLCFSQDLCLSKHISYPHRLRPTSLVNPYQTKTLKGYCAFSV